MDVLLSIATGLAVRMFFDSHNNSLGRFGPVLIGLWEGVAVHYQCTTSSLFLDQSLAYALRVAVDFYVTSDPLRELIILLFTTLGFVASETLKPKRSRRRVHHRRSTRSSVPVQYKPEPLTVLPTLIHPSCPPTPPSVFLERKSHAILTCSDSLTTSSTASNGEIFTSRPRYIPLLTPPCTLSEVQDKHVDHLPTFEEHHSGEEGAQSSILVAVPGTHEASHTPVPAPSVTTPLPVPNITIQSATPAARASHPSEAVPLPVPNMNTKYYMSEDDDGDPLQTPPPGGLQRWELDPTDDDDGLTTPPAHQLSPLALEPALLPCFGQAAVSADAAVPSPSPLATATEVVATKPVPLAVEYSPVVLQCDPDSVSEPTLDSRLTEIRSESEAGRESRLDYVPSSAVRKPDHDQQAQHAINVDSSPNGKFIEGTGQETETETETASMISSHPAAIMYSRAEALRSEARVAEAEHIRLKEGLKHVHGVKMLFLKQQMQEQEDLARKLHCKAARRFFKGEWCLSVVLNKPFVFGWRIRNTVLYSPDEFDVDSKSNPNSLFSS
ncbi:hypothetical protein C0993_007937 [Termitomyces sp. T159_Od127]|nr:hypothetical protein C0993_007937 [Termitomyces sp. T159_Od127]